MLSKAKPKLFMLFLILLFLFHGLQVSAGYEIPYPLTTEEERCIRRCYETESDVPGRGRCVTRCKGSGREGGEGRDLETSRAEVEECRRRCGEEETRRRELQKCQERCEEEVIKKREEEQERGQESQSKEHEREREKGRDGKGKDTRQEYERCRQSCQSQDPRQKQQCQERCDREYERQKREWEEKEHGRGRGNPTKSRETEQQTSNPYHFHAQRLQSRFRTEEGHIRVLENFLERSELLRGIENYRLSVMEANPNTFVVPHHSDAESLAVVINGKGTISYVLREKRESSNLETGDVIRIPAGAVVYMINHDNNEKLSLAKLIMPVNVPGNFREYFAAGGENPESFYRIFSNDVLEAALDTPRDELDRLFGQQRQGVILKAPQKQLKAITRRVSSSTRQEGQGPFNLLNQQPLYSNRYGNFVEASPNEYKQLQDIDISVAYSEIKRGSLMLPHYNSRSTEIVLVLEGKGRMEMACPHLPRESQKEFQERIEQEETKRTEQYQKISSNLSPGDVLIIPAGHPVAIVASQNQNLRTLGFGVNAWNNERNFLAGQKDNVMNEIEMEAKEISFNSPEELIERVFRNQKESHFAAQKGERRQREEGRGGGGGSIPSILDFGGFF